MTSIANQNKTGSRYRCCPKATEQRISIAMITIKYDDIFGQITLHTENPENDMTKCHKEMEAAEVALKTRWKEIPKILKRLTEAVAKVFEVSTLPPDDGEAASVSARVGNAILTVRRGRIDSTAMAGLTIVEVDILPVVA